MAGDWIKMRGNLWDDPRVAKMVDMTDSSEAAIVGALYWLWATADQHTEDGIMEGLTLRGIDRKTGVKGFGDALVAIGWVADHPDGVRIIDFEKHNGTSAKKRCATAKRVSVYRTGNDDVTQQALQDEHESVTSALAREEKRREENNNTPLPPDGGGGVVFPNPKPKPGELTPGFVDFWETWPVTDRKQARGKCFDVWKKAKLEADAAVICAHVAHLKTTESWTKQDGQFVPAPLVYLQGKRWDGAIADTIHSSGILAGAI